MPLSTPSSTVASAVTTSCWGSPVLGEACWLPHKQQMLLSSYALGGGPGLPAPCWEAGGQGKSEPIMTFTSKNRRFIVPTFFT